MSQPEHQEDPARTAAVQAVQNHFMEFDPEKKGAIPAEHFGAVLAKCGYTSFTPKMLANAEALVDVAGEGTVSFGAFIWFWDLLNATVAAFNPKVQNGFAPTAELGTILAGMGYANLAPRTVVALQTLTDPTHTGHFDFNALVTTLLFIRFTLNLFASADTEQKGSLSFAQMEALLPNLNIHGASTQQAKVIFDAHDLDKSGTMDAFEFIDLALALKFPQLAAH